MIDVPYILVQDIQELERPGGKKNRRTTVVNTYDNSLREDQVWEAVGIETRHIALGNTKWDWILEGSTVLLGNLNTHSLHCNIHYRERRGAAGLEAPIETLDLICENEREKLTRPTRGQVTSIIVLTFTSIELIAMESLIIDEEPTTVLENKLIVFQIANLNDMIGSMGTSQETTRCALKDMSQ